jgi:hypothetical protein
MAFHQIRIETFHKMKILLNAGIHPFFIISILGRSQTGCMGSTSSSSHKISFRAKIEEFAATGTEPQQYSQERGKVHQFSSKFSSDSGADSLPTSLGSNQGSNC